MANKWIGFPNLLNRDNKLQFIDLDNIWGALQNPDVVQEYNDDDGKLVKIYLRQPWGAALAKIAGSDATDLNKNRYVANVAELCWRIYATVLYGIDEAMGERPWENSSSKVWKDNKQCP